MFDIGWQELIVIGIIAILVVGPKELPGLLREVGRWAGKARSVAREFQRSMEDAAREADIQEFNQLRDVKREVEKMGRVDYSEQARRAQSSMKSQTKTASAASGGAAPPPGGHRGQAAGSSAPASTPAPSKPAAPKPAAPKPAASTGAATGASTAGGATDAPAPAASADEPKA